jgi:hypothetical protein
VFFKNRQNQDERVGDGRITRSSGWAHAIKTFLAEAGVAKRDNSTLSIVKPVLDATLQTACVSMRWNNLKMP